MNGCNGCQESNKNNKIVFTEWAYEEHESRHEREKQRPWVLCLILVVLLVATNAMWIIYESQFDVVETTEEIVVDAEGEGTANYIGQGGVIINGENNHQENYKEP